MSPYNKTIIAVIGAAVTAALGTVPEGSTSFTVLTIVAAAITALGVYVVPNTPGPTPHRRATYNDDTHPPDMM